MMNQTTTVHFPHLWPDGKWEWAKGVIGYIRTAAAIWYEVRSPAAVTDEPIDNRQNFPTWKKILLAVIHFLFLFFFLGKREIEEEVNQARALTYSTKKENCAVVNSLWGAWFVWIAFKAGSRPLLTLISLVLPHFFLFNVFASGEGIWLDIWSHVRSMSLTVRPWAPFLSLVGAQLVITCQPLRSHFPWGKRSGKWFQHERFHQAHGTNFPGACSAQQIS
jgi:hypothetical protein